MKIILIIIFSVLWIIETIAWYKLKKDEKEMNHVVADCASLHTNPIKYFIQKDIENKTK